MRKPRILLLDIETAPDVVWTWRVREANAIAVKEHWYILSFASRWYGEKGILCKGLCDYAGRSERRLLEDIHQLLSRADLVVAHNGINFDIRKIMARFIAQKLLPPAPFKVVDTKKGIQEAAAFSSNKLDWLCQQLGIGKKLEHEGWPMWEGCMKGDPSSWAKMKRYNRHDIVLLEELYTTISPYIKQPNNNMWSEGVTCPNPACGSENLQKRGIARNETREYIRFQCQDCGKWGRATTSLKRKALVVGI